MVQMSIHPESLWDPFRLPLPCKCQYFLEDYRKLLEGTPLTQNLPGRPGTAKFRVSGEDRNASASSCVGRLLPTESVTEGQQGDIPRLHQSSSKSLQTGAGLLREIISMAPHSDHISHSSAEEQYKFLSSQFMWPLRFIPSDRSLRFLLFFFFFPQIH